MVPCTGSSSTLLRVQSDKESTMLVCARCRLPATVTRKFDAKEHSGGLTLELQAVQARGSSETDSSTSITDTSSSSTDAAAVVIADIGNPLQQFDDRDYPVIATVCARS
jgi:hypothetical protein